MTDKASNKLFEAFREDHAVLGRGFFDIASGLRDNNLAAARAAAMRMDREAGAHIVFEEEHFYPALARFLDPAEVDDMYAEHEIGRAVISALLKHADDDELDEQDRRQLLEQTETMQTHIAECGTLFGAMGGLQPDEQAALYQALTDLREHAPRWSQYQGHRAQGNAPG